jgi:6-phosphogluconate dehydrogenase
MMAAFAEGINILKHASVGKQTRAADAETTPLRHPEHYQYDFDLPEVAEVWRRGSVISSWLLDLTAQALLETISPTS